MSAPSQVSPRTIWTVGLNLLALGALLLVVREAREVISWSLVALFLALAADPAVRILERAGLERGWAAALVFFSGLGLVALTVFTVAPMFVEQGRALVEAAPGYVESLRHHAAVESLEARFQLVTRVSRELRARAPTVAGPMIGFVTDVLERVLAFVTTAVLTLFFLLFGRDAFDKAMLWVVPTKQAHWRELAAKMHRTVGGYVAGAALISLIGGVVTSGALLLLGSPYFLPLGLMMMLLGLIPFVGAFIGAVLVVGTTFLSSGARAGLIALGVFLAYQQVENHLLQPLIQRRTLKMNPLFIALVMLVATSLAGVAGALLALPAAGAAQVLLQDRLASRAK